MLGCIEEVKKEALEKFKDVPPSQILRIRRKPTKNKVFDFDLINFGKPTLRIFINSRFYKILIFSNGKWTELEENAKKEVLFCS